MSTEPPPCTDIGALRDEVARLTARLDREHVGLIQALCISRSLVHALGIVATHLEDQNTDTPGAPGTMPGTAVAMLKDQIAQAEVEIEEAVSRFSEEDRKRSLDGMVTRALAHLRSNAADAVRVEGGRHGTAARRLTAALDRGPGATTRLTAARVASLTRPGSHAIPATAIIAAADAANRKA